MAEFRVYDSEKGEEYPEQGRYAAAYEPVWQSLRESCRHNWEELPTIRLNCARLELYLHRGGEAERPVRTWRVFNLLNALPYNQTTSIGIHFMDSAAVDFLLAYADKVRKEYHSLPRVTEWDWAISRRNLIRLWKSNPTWLIYLYRVISSDRKKPNRKPELLHYLAMNIEIINSREETYE